RLGVENLLEPEQLSTLEGEDVGLITNPTGTDSSLRSTIDLLIEAQDEGGFTLTTLYGPEHGVRGAEPAGGEVEDYIDEKTDRKSTRLNSSHVSISYAVFCSKKKIHQHDVA